MFKVCFGRAWKMCLSENTSAAWPGMCSKAQNHRCPRTRCAPAPRITHLPTQPAWPNGPPNMTGTSGGAHPPFWRGVPPQAVSFASGATMGSILGAFGGSFLNNSPAPGGSRPLGTCVFVYCWSAVENCACFLCIVGINEARLMFVLFLGSRMFAI